MTLSINNAWLRRLALGGALLCLGGVMAPKPADAQLSIQLPFLSVGVGGPYYYPSYYPYYSSYYYGYPYYHRTHYWGWRHRCHLWHHRCHWY
ncbi:MAG TPA: hypothetical protein VG308_20470 [Stellaceae bacterium]|jgi:hypothetical protein|nr:hypothetical protein [Stellaceae bacterium]